MPCVCVCVCVCERVLYLHCARLACQCTGSTARLGDRGGRRASATRLAPSGVCCHFGGGVPPTRYKRRRQQRRTGTVFTLCVCVCVCASGVASFVLQPCLLPPSPPSFLIWHSTQRAHSSLIKHRLICVLKPECLHRCSYLNYRRYIVLNYT